MRYRNESESAQKKKLEISEAKISSKSNSVQSENMVGVVTRSQKRLSVNIAKNETPSSTSKTSRSASKTRNSSRRALLESLEESSGNASTPQSTTKRKIQDKTPEDATTLSGSRPTSVSRVRRSSRNTKFLSSNDGTTPVKKDNRISNSTSKRKESKGRHIKKADLNDVQVESDTVEDNVKKENKKTGANRSLRSKKLLNFSPPVTDKQNKKTNSKRKSFPTEEDKALVLVLSDHDIEVENEGEITSSKKSDKAEIMNLSSSSPGIKPEGGRGGGEEEEEEEEEAVETFNSSDEPSKKTSEIEAQSDTKSRMPPMNASNEGLDEKRQTSYDKFNRNTESENETCKVKSSKKAKGSNNDCSPGVSTSAVTSHKPQLGICNKIDSEFLSEHKTCSDDEYVKYDSPSDDFNEEATKDCSEKKCDEFMEEVESGVRVLQSTSIKKDTNISPKKEIDSTQIGLPSPPGDQQCYNASESPGHTKKRVVHSNPKVNSCLVLKTQVKKSESSDSDSDAESRKAIMESAQKRIIQNISTSESESRKFVKPLLKSSKQKISSDSDSAPENISFSAGRKLAMDSLKNAVESIQLEKQRRKEKRKQRLEKYKQQKEETLIRLKEKRASQEDASCSSSEESGYEEDDLSSAFSRKNETKKQGIKREKENLDDVPQSKAKKIESDNEAAPKEKKEKKRKLEHRDDSRHYGSLRPLPDDVLENLPDQLPNKLPKLGSDTVSKREKHGKHERVKDNQLQCRDFRSRNDVDFIPLNTYGATDFGVMPLDTLKKASKSMAEQAAEFRQKMLYGSHIMRIRANSQAIYQQKLKASGKDAFVR
ncbi:micronuclear linker histone polyprotein-like [Periplaneta americana]|uniref:micronuclear linker histone polyprotein-like n=1 Tax=Periplaneta americana TaxID=6978 RepID=UPI0037E94FD9